MNESDLDFSLDNTLTGITYCAAFNGISETRMIEKSRILLLNQKKIQERFDRLNEYAKNLMEVREKIDTDKESYKFKVNSFQDNFEYQVNSLNRQFKELKNDSDILNNKITENSITKHKWKEKIDKVESEIRGLETHLVNLQSRLSNLQSRKADTLLDEIKGTKNVISELDMHIQQVKEVIKSHRKEKEYVRKETEKEKKFIVDKRQSIVDKKMNEREYKMNHAKEMKTLKSKVSKILEIKKENRGKIEKSGAVRDVSLSKYDEVNKKLKKLNAKKAEIKKIQQGIIAEIKENKSEICEIKEKNRELHKAYKRKNKTDRENEAKILELSIQEELVLSSGKNIEREQEIANEKLETNLNKLQSIELKIKMMNMDKYELDELLNETEILKEKAQSESELLASKLEMICNNKFSEIDEAKVNFKKAKHKVKTVLDKIKDDFEAKQRLKLSKEEIIEQKKENIERKEKIYEETLEKVYKVEEDIKRDLMMKEKLVDTMKLIANKVILEKESWEISHCLPESRLNSWEDQFLDNMIACSKTFTKDTQINYKKKK